MRYAKAIAGAVAILLLVLAIAVACQPVPPNTDRATGDTNFTGIVTSGNADIGGTLNYGANDLYPIGSASSGKAVVCGSTTITGTGVLSTAISTPEAVLLTMAGDANYDHNRLSHTNAAATVTAKVWNGAATPAAAATGVAVDYCVIGVR